MMIDINNGGTPHPSSVLYRQILKKAKALTKQTTRFFVNLQTGKSQWEKPEAPAQKQEELHEPPSGPPPSYEDSSPADPFEVPNTSEKKAFGSNNPYNQSGTSEDTVESDARLAARLQAEENARSSTQSPAAAQPGAATDYYNETSQSQPQGLSPGQSPGPQNTSRGTRDRSRSFLSKLIGKKTSSGSSSSSNAGYGYGYSRPPPPAPPQQPYGYPPVGYHGGYSQPGYGYPQYPMGGGGGYYPSRPQRHGGMGNAGAAALGVGGGLLGGAMLANAFDDHGDTYIENNYDGDGDHGGDDYGGGDDFGGGDFGGDF